MPPRYIMQRSGHPLITWDRMRPPGQTRAADTAAMGLGSLGNTDVFDQARRLPRGGAPEYINDGFSGMGATAIEYGDPNSTIVASRSTMGPRNRARVSAWQRRRMAGMGDNPVDVITGAAQSVLTAGEAGASSIVGGALSPGIIAPAQKPGILDTVAGKLGVSSNTVLLGAAAVGAYFLFVRKK